MEIKFPSMISNLSMTEYQSVEAAHFSLLKGMDNPARAILKDSGGMTITQQMALGSAVHTLLLEPDIFTSKYTLLPENINKRTKEGKLQWEEFEANLNGKKVINKETALTCETMVSMVMRHPLAKKLVTETHHEVSIFWEEGGLKCKARLDMLKDGLIVDLKTCALADQYNFSRQIADQKYHLQAHFYMRGLATQGCFADQFLFIAVENTPPHSVAIYSLDAKSINSGKILCEIYLKTYKNCLLKGLWQADDLEPKIISVPSWALLES